MKRSFLFVLFSSALGLHAIAQVKYPGNGPGAATAKQAAGSYTLQNDALAVTFTAKSGKLTVNNFTDKETHEQLGLTKPYLFELELDNGKKITSVDFSLTGAPAVEKVEGNSSAINVAGRLDGKQVTAELEDKAIGLKIHWHAALLDGSNYIKQSFTFDAAASVKINRIILVDLPSAIGLQKEGTVDGSPVVHKNMFFAIEHPMSQTGTGKTAYEIFLPRLNAVEAGSPLTVSSVWGVTPTGQLRRGFLYYIERERAAPYHQMAHYNSWFDISWDNRKLNDSVCLDRIKVYNDSLIQKRDVKLKAFLFDDGWDDNRTLWQFNAGFPDGFTHLKAAATEAHAGLGVWISPWGGYDKPKEQRLEYGKKQNPPFETNENGFSLTGPVYYKRFNEVASAFINKYGISMFKFDGVGAGNGASGASITYQKDIEAFLKLINGLREQKPDLYLSLTVGTWPSVYWLKYGDAIWRAGDDTGIEGEGPKREQWMNYRDGQTYQNIVKRAPLYPLNAVMYHGVCIADNGLPGTLEMNDKDISNEIWSFFGNGTSLQELYINPHKLNTANWNTLRDAINWSRANAEALADTHWVGGDPAKGQVYGYAGWDGKNGVLELRNPTAHTQTFTVNVKKALDIPAGKSSAYGFYNAKTVDHARLYKGETFTVTLAPFEVKVMNARPL